VCDVLVPLPDPLLGRALPGDGPIDHRHLRACVEAAGYGGPIEVEVFNADLWARPGGEVLAETVAAFERHVA
jgi:sugar phosphate isomerase/epimerase